MVKYSDNQIQSQSKELKDWEYVDNAIEKKFKF